MHVLVTGGAGFVGSSLIGALRDIATSSTSVDEYSSGKKAHEHAGVTYMHGSTECIEDVLPASYVPDIIYHFGEFSRIVPSFDMPDKTLSSNLTGTYKVLLYAVKHKAKVVYSGSSSFLGTT